MNLIPRIAIICPYQAASVNGACGKRNKSAVNASSREKKGLNKDRFVPSDRKERADRHLSQTDLASYGHATLTKREIAESRGGWEKRGGPEFQRGRGEKVC